jgi:sialic acid synthase SpsE
MSIVDKGVYVISEIGNNHNGSLDKAFKLISESHKAGADAVKFQSFRGQDIVSPKIKTKDYIGWEKVNYEYWFEFADSIALPLNDHQKVIDYACECGIDFITTPVSPFIVEYLEGLSGISSYKIASMDLNNYGLLKAIAGTNKSVIISTGMGDLSEIDKAIEILGEREISILHCVSDYPLNPKDANLNNIKILQDRFPKKEIGFSDHSLGHELALASVMIGATLIEKHFTLDRSDPSPAEHHFSMEPTELNKMVEWIRTLEINLKETEWARSSNEEIGRKMFRRSFHYKKRMGAGHKISQKDLTFVRPGTGINYNELEDFINQILVRDVDEYEPCKISDIRK